MRMFISKTNLKYAFILFFTAFIACSETEVIKEPSVVEISPITLEATSQGEQIIKFYAASDWTASLSNTSWIEIDPMTKVGSKGDAEIKLKWNENNGVKERISDLTLVIQDEEPRIVRITQLPKGPYVIAESNQLELVVNPALANGRGAFVSELTILSNVKWEIKSLPEWITYTTENDKLPVEGIQTEIKLLLQANPAKFNASVMTEKLILGNGANTDSDLEVEVKVVSSIITNNTAGQATNQIVLERSAAAANRYVGEMIVESNTSWTIDTQSLPAWLTIPVADNGKEYSTSLLTNKTVKVFFNEDLIDTDRLETEILVTNSDLNLAQKVTIVFPGTGLDYYESLLYIPSEFEFSASKWDANWQPVPDAVMDMNFSMLSGSDYTGMHDAPFKFFLIEGQNGFPLKQQAYWAGIDYEGKAQGEMKTPLNKHNFVLWVQDNFGGRREGYVIITDKDVTFDDLFLNEEGDLKPEFDETKTYFAQKAAKQNDFECSIQDNYVAFGKASDVQHFDIYSTPESVSTNITEHEWLSIDLIRDDFGNMQLKVSVKENTTGAARFQEVQVSQFISDDVPDEIIYTFLVEQAAE